MYLHSCLVTQPILFDIQLFALITNVHCSILLQDSALENSPEFMIQRRFKLLRSRSQTVTYIFVLLLISVHTKENLQHQEQ